MTRLTKTILTGGSFISVSRPKPPRPESIRVMWILPITPSGWAGLNPGQLHERGPVSSSLIKKQLVVMMTVWSWAKLWFLGSANSTCSNYWLTLEEMCPLESVLIVEYLYTYICSISPRICVVCHSKISTCWNFVNIFVKILKAIILIKWEGDFFLFLKHFEKIFSNYFVLNFGAKKQCRKP